MTRAGCLTVLLLALVGLAACGGERDDLDARPEHGLGDRDIPDESRPFGFGR